MFILLPFVAIGVAAAPHEPIEINTQLEMDLGELVLANGVRGGSGTPQDPYIISEWEIETQEEFAIRINVPNIHVRFQNLQISGNQMGGGILMTDSSFEGQDIELIDVGIAFGGNRVTGALEGGTITQPRDRLGVLSVPEIAFQPTKSVLVSGSMYHLSLDAFNGELVNFGYAHDLNLSMTDGEFELIHSDASRSLGKRGTFTFDNLDFWAKEGARVGMGYADWVSILDCDWITHDGDFFRTQNLEISDSKFSSPGYGFMVMNADLRNSTFENMLRVIDGFDGPIGSIYSENNLYRNNVWALLVPGASEVVSKFDTFDNNTGAIAGPVGASTVVEPTLIGTGENAISIAFPAKETPFSLGMVLLSLALARRPRP